MGESEREGYLEVHAHLVRGGCRGSELRPAGQLWLGFNGLSVER